MPSSEPSEIRQRWATQIRKGVLELCILSVLAQEDEYGYSIVQRLKAIDGLTLTEGTVYPILNRLHKEDCISIYRAASESGPPRKWFRLTAAGRRRLRAMTADWRQVSSGVEQLLDAGLPESKTVSKTVRRTS